MGMQREGGQHCPEEGDQGCSEERCGEPVGEGRHVAKLVGAVVALVGTTVGVFAVSAVAYAEMKGNGSFGAWMVAANALGALVGGLAVGGGPWRWHGVDATEQPLQRSRIYGGPVSSLPRRCPEDDQHVGRLGETNRPDPRQCTPTALVDRGASAGGSTTGHSERRHGSSGGALRPARAAATSAGTLASSGSSASAAEDVIADSTRTRDCLDLSMTRDSMGPPTVDPAA